MFVAHLIHEVLGFGHEITCKVHEIRFDGHEVIKFFLTIKGKMIFFYQ